MKGSGVFHPALPIVHLGRRNGGDFWQRPTMPSAGEGSRNGIPALKVSARARDDMAALHHEMSDNCQTRGGQHLFHRRRRGGSASDKPPEALAVCLCHRFASEAAMGRGSGLRPDPGLHRRTPVSPASLFAPSDQSPDRLRGRDRASHSRPALALSESSAAPGSASSCRRPTPRSRLPCPRARPCRGA